MHELYQGQLQEAKYPACVDVAADREEFIKERLRHQCIQNEQLCQISELKSHLASVIDRTTRIRNAYEKEKKQLQSQACR
jgi:hypothetical protein